MHLTLPGKTLNLKQPYFRHWCHASQYMLIHKAVEKKKGNQRFLKLQFLYFIGMEARRLFFTQQFVKHGQSRKRLAFFTLTSPCANPKTHT